MKNIFKTTFVVTFLCLFSCQLQAQVLFNLSSTLPVGSDPNSIAVADINGDGKADLICANYLGNTLSVLTNNSSGGYVLSGTYGNVGSFPIVATTADVNGDGKVDLICVGSTLTVLTNNGTGGFVRSGQYTTVGNGPAWVTAADVNGDGKVDLISANWGSGSGSTLTVLTNNGSGGFVIASAPVTGNGPICVRAVDVNGDGKVDLISANMTDSTLSISTNSGSGGFILAATCPVGNGSRFVTAADVNGDGRPDLISANWGDNTLTVLTNNGSGDFGFQSTITVGNGALFVAAADINGDGAVDLICANNTDYTLTVVTNSGGGGFILATNLSVGGNPNCVVALDVNGDGRLDLISASYQNNALIVWMNATPFLPFAPPGITAQPISITNLAGSTATFSVEASGGALAYQWQFNGTNLAVATNSLLILPNLAPSQAGSYSVLVSNALGSTNSLAATLTVLAYPPTITAQPTNQAVLVGGTAPFSVSASGTGPLSYQWAFNGLNIDGATSATLTLGNVQLTNAGNYSVVVTNTSGSILSSNALLTVNPAPANVPVITAFSPQSGADGTMVNITGFNFDPTPGNNTVHFGAVRAVVSAASTTNLVVDVPVGATFAPIAETVNGLTAYAGAPFLPTFPSSGTLTNSSLGSQITLPTGNGPGKALIADFDGDGKSDLAVNCGNYHTVYVYRNISTNGTLTAGSFAPPVVLQLGTGGEEEMAAADLTGDGKLDLVFLDYNFNAVGVLQNLCTPGSITTNSFGPRVNFAVGSGPVGVALQDLDGDGKPEIVTANLGGGTISVLRNLGTASMITTNSFAPAVNFAGPTSVRAVAIADMDGDGKPDVVALNWVSGSYNSAVSVFRNVSTLRNIAFASRVDFPGLSYCYKMAIGDMDEDGKLDAVFVSFAKGQSVSVYRNTGAPGNFTTNSFAPRVDFGLGGWGNGVTLGDLDGDGKPDVAAVTQSSSQLSLFRNISAPGSFSSSSLAGRLNFASGTNPYGVAIGDLDGDGRPEVVLVNNSAASISIYQNVVPFGGPPVVTTQPQCQTNVVGSTVSFGVVASGTVPLGYQWVFGGANIIGATNATLTLNHVQLTNVGNYMVMITNIAGSTNSVTARLSVVLPPVITQQPQSQSVASYTSASFTVAATGSGPLNYQWRKGGTNLVDGSNVSGSTTTNLTLTSVSMNDGGNYDVVVSNPYATTNSAVAVLTVPQTGMMLGSASAMSGNTVVVPVLMNALGVENTFLTSVGYDPAMLVLQSVQLGQATAGTFLLENDTKTNSGLIGIAIQLNTGMGVPAGTNEQVALLTFQAMPVTSNTTVSVFFTNNPTRQQTLDNNFDLLPTVYSNGIVTLLPAEYAADVYPRISGDSQVEARDWQEVGRMVAGLDVPTNSDEFARADCAPRGAPDGILTVADWVQAGRYALNLDPLTLVTMPPVPDAGVVKNFKFTPYGGPSPARTLQIASVVAQRGQMVSVPVQLTCAASENAVGLTVSFDTNRLKLIRVTLGSAMTGGRTNINYNRPGKVGMVVAMSPGASLAAGTNQLLVLQFSTLTKASGPVALTLDSSVVQLQVVDNTANALAANYVSGTVVLPPQPVVKTVKAGENLQLTWPASTGTFHVESAGNPLGPWSDASLAITTNGANATVTVTPAGQQQFFRLVGQ